MEIENFNKTRKELNSLMESTDEFFKLFIELDELVYSSGAIPKKYKELTGLSIAVSMRCHECVLFHLQGCVTAKASKEEIIEAIKLGVMGGGSITYPTARFAFKTLKELNLI